jgi:hypothetical protein
MKLANMETLRGSPSLPATVRCRQSRPAPHANSLRQVLVYFALIALASCGGSSSSGDGGSSNSATCNPVAFAMLNVFNSEAKVCAATVQCIADSCSDTAKTCAGPDWASGVYTGTCASYFDCVKSCNCQKACVDKCDPGTLDCSSCISSELGMGCTLTCSSAIASCGK